MKAGDLLISRFNKSYLPPGIIISEITGKYYTVFWAHKLQHPVTGTYTKTYLHRHYKVMQSGAGILY
jgi:hypothetical protein